MKLMGSADENLEPDTLLARSQIANNLDRAGGGLGSGCNSARAGTGKHFGGKKLVCVCSRRMLQHPSGRRLEAFRDGRCPLDVTRVLDYEVNLFNVAARFLNADHIRVLGQGEDNLSRHVVTGGLREIVDHNRKGRAIRNILRHTDTTKQDVVVMTARIYHREYTFSGNLQYDSEELFEEYEQQLFTKVVEVAEKEGKYVSLMVVPSADVFDGIVQTAQRLESSKIVSGLSNKLTLDQQGKLTGDAWERLPEPRPRLKLEVHTPDGTVDEYWLGPHTPRLREEDLDVLHKLWLDATTDPELASLHHYHIVRAAIEELRQEIDEGRREDVLNKLKSEMQRGEKLSQNSELSKGYTSETPAELKDPSPPSVRH